MKRFFLYLWGTVIKPKKTFQFLLRDKNHLAYGTSAVLFIGILYTLTVIGLTVIKAKIVTPAWVNIPVQHYYFWEIFFALPVFLLGWFLAAGIIHIISKLFNGKGTYEKTLALLGFALTIPSFITWIPETIGVTLFVSGVFSQKDWLDLISKPGFWKIFANSYQYVTLAWYLILFSIAVSVSQKLKWKQSILVGTLAIAIVGFLMIIFIR